MSNQECIHGIDRMHSDCEKCAVEEAIAKIATWVEATTDFYTSFMLAERIRRREWE